MSNKKFEKLEKLIEQLAISVGKGFEEVHNELRHINHRLHMVETRLDTVDTRLDTIDHRLERVEFNTSGHDQRLNILEDKVRQISTKIGLQFN